MCGFGLWAVGRVSCWGIRSYWSGCGVIGIGRFQKGDEFADPHPNKASVGASQRHVREIFILRHQNEVVRCCMPPNLGVRCLPETHIRNVFSLAAEVRLYKPREGWRELVVDEESHADSRTG